MQVAEAISLDLALARDPLDRGRRPLTYRAGLRHLDGGRLAEARAAFLRVQGLGAGCRDTEALEVVEGRLQQPARDEPADDGLPRNAPPRDVGTVMLRPWLFPAIVAIAAVFVVIVVVANLHPGSTNSPPVPTESPHTPSATPSATPTPVPTPLPAGSAVFDDNFTSNMGWDLSPSSDGNFVTASKPGALHGTVKAGGGWLYGEQIPVAGTRNFAKLRIDATMARTGGDGDFGLECLGTDNRAYEFLISSGGTARILAYSDPSNGATQRQLARASVSQWDPSQRHVLAVACVTGQGGTDLTLQVDGTIVATASDTAHGASFEAFILVESTEAAALDVDIVHATVANLA